jgi:hypothetical protein
LTSSRARRIFGGWSGHFVVESAIRLAAIAILAAPLLSAQFPEQLPFALSRICQGVQLQCRHPIATGGLRCSPFEPLGIRL